MNFLVPHHMPKRPGPVAGHGLPGCWAGVSGGDGLPPLTRQAVVKTLNVGRGVGVMFGDRAFSRSPSC